MSPNMRDSPRPSTDKGAQAEATHGECGGPHPATSPPPNSPESSTVVLSEASLAAPHETPAAQEGGGPRQASGLPSRPPRVASLRTRQALAAVAAPLRPLLREAVGPRGLS